MSEALRRYRVGEPGADDWFDSLDAAHAAIAARLGVAAGDLEARRRRISVDPIVVRREDGRWRSAALWIYRSDSGSVRVAEMVHVDESAYDH